MCLHCFELYINPLHINVYHSRASLICNTLHVLMCLYLNLARTSLDVRIVYNSLSYLAHNLVLYSLAGTYIGGHHKTHVFVYFLSRTFIRYLLGRRLNAYFCFARTSIYTVAYACMV